MRASVASIVFAFCAIVAVHGAPVSSDSTVVARTEPWTYDADGNEVMKRGEHDFEYDAYGNEIGADGEIVEKVRKTKKVIPLHILEP